MKRLEERLDARLRLWPERCASLLLLAAGLSALACDSSGSAPSKVGVMAHAAGETGSGNATAGSTPIAPMAGLAGQGSSTMVMSNPQAGDGAGTKDPAAARDTPSDAGATKPAPSEDEEDATVADAGKPPSNPRDAAAPSPECALSFAQCIMRNPFGFAECSAAATPCGLFPDGTPSAPGAGATDAAAAPSPECALGFARCVMRNPFGYAECAAEAADCGLFP